MGRLPGTTSNRFEFCLFQNDLSTFTLNEHDHASNFDSEFVSHISGEGYAEVRLNLTAPESLLQKRSFWVSW